MRLPLPNQVEATQMNAQLFDQSLAVDWVVVEDEDWSGVNDCGAIHMPAEPINSIAVDDEWPIEPCS
jgi:hypothetical protein